MSNYYQQRGEQPTCKYCSTPEKKVPIKFKKRDDGGWDRFNLDGTPHDRKYCDSVKAGTINIATQTIPQTITAPQNTGAIDPHLNSILIKVSDLAKAVMELKQLLFNLEKSAQTNATVIDTMAQKIELILAKQGYPEPEKLIKDMATAQILPNMVKVDPIHYKCKECGKVYPDYNSHSKEYCGECFVKEEDLVIDPKRVPKEALEENIGQNIEKHENNESLANAKEVFKEQVLPAMERTVPSEKGKPWAPISEMFTCDSCHTKSANGFEKYGTKICPDCNDEFESNNKEAQNLDKEEFDKMNNEYDY